MVGLTEIEAIRRRAFEANELANYGGRPPDAETQLRNIETHYAGDVMTLLAEIGRLRAVVRAERVYREIAEQVFVRSQWPAGRGDGAPGIKESRREHLHAMVADAEADGLYDQPEQPAAPE